MSGFTDLRHKHLWNEEGGLTVLAHTKYQFSYVPRPVVILSSLLFLEYRIMWFISHSWFFEIIGDFIWFLTPLLLITIIFKFIIYDLSFDRCGRFPGAGRFPRCERRWRWFRIFCWLFVTVLKFVVDWFSHGRVGRFPRGEGRECWGMGATVYIHCRRFDVNFWV